MNKLNTFTFYSQQIAKAGIALIAVISSSILLTSLTHAATLGQNIIVNGDAEQGEGDPIGNAVGTDIPFIPGWIPTDSFSVLQYGATGFEFTNPLGNIVAVSGLPNVNSSGPNVRGKNLFFGGANRSSSSASQLIDIANLASIIDAGQGTYDLSAWLGGYGTDLDNVKFSLNFLNQDGQSLDTAFITSTTPEERNNTTGLLFQSTKGFVPVAARQINVALDMNYVRGRVNDSYADNLSLVITKVPESDSIFGLLVAISVICLLISDFTTKSTNGKCTRSGQSY
ncbi:PEP-CTERM sorting domain-containing protein [Nostoc sp. DedQUE09]|uniref:PEP-CTERM sorting domain-containing protein n=1 Tax=Nostoc sp. DedQUE09 TaxID=3075394 RepID=UPI002AD1EA1B|nr:PEP-CTERM sorting domain-containing protein [Nostoc sp. DedQUE09]MDZ7950273.1 PEP-CTERM sorting domain-containing protein [Nostoc sp. DedQUE09]